MNFILPKKLNVVSDSAPVIAAEASMAGATNSAYPTRRPSGSRRSPMSPPTPIPIENRQSTGSTNPEIITTQYIDRRQLMFRSVTDAARRPAPSNETSRSRTRLTIGISDHQPPAEPGMGQPPAEGAPAQQVDRMPQADQARRPAEHRVPAQLDTVPQRQYPGDPAQHDGQRLDREE